MRALAVTNIGAEDAAVLEAKELISASGILKGDGAVSFEVKSLIDLCAFCYRSQSANKVMLLLGSFIVEPGLEPAIENLRKALDIKALGSWLSKDKSFKVECTRLGEHDFRSVDFEIEAGKIIHDVAVKSLGFSARSDFENPDVLLHVYVNQGKGYAGIDFSGIELSKRQYKIFNHPESLKGTTGYALLRKAGYESGKTLLDPFIGSGVIVVEAALFARNYPVQFYSKDRLAFTRYAFFKDYGYDRFFSEQDAAIRDIKPRITGYDRELRYLKAAQKNAKLAGIEDSLELSKVDVEWLDIKMEKGSVDMIVTDPPRMSKNRDNKKIEKVYQEFFYQAAYILKKSGRIILLAKDAEDFKKVAENNKFKITDNYLYHQGKEIYQIVTFVRG